MKGGSHQPRADPQPDIGQSAGPHRAGALFNAHGANPVVEVDNSFIAEVVSSPTSAILR